MTQLSHLAEFDSSRLCVVAVAAGVDSAHSTLTIVMQARGDDFAATFAEVFMRRIRQVDRLERKIQ